MSARRVIIPLRAGSDGDATHRPNSSAYSELDPPMLYLEKIGTQWMQARGEARPGIVYVLQSLPVGYALFQRPRANNPQHLDKYLFGHPSHKTFDSPNRFFPHFKYLMENNGESIGCPCTVCNPNSGVLPKTGSTSSRASKSSSSAPRASSLSPVPVPFSQQKGRPKMVSVGMDTTRIDEEGTPDVYRNLIDKLKRHITLDEAIREPMSFDWRAEQELLPSLLERLEDAQWVPRVGDIVLFVRELPHGAWIRRDNKSGEYKLWDRNLNTFANSLAWEAGLVGQTPDEDIDIVNIIEEGQKEMNVSYSGVRVEPIPSPNDLNKSLSKRYKYLPVHHTRPFTFWRELLSYVSEEKWHPTIKNALTLMSTMSLIDKYRFRGTWPDAQIYCRGIYIGSEMLAIGDTVRLFPKANQLTCTDIMVIKSIRLKWSNLDKASSNDYDEGRPYNSEIWIYGSAFTMDISRSNKQWITDSNATAPKASEEYGTWYPLHPASKELAVPFSRLVGRLYECDAMTAWLDSEFLATIDHGREGVLEARAFAREHDKRITDAFDATWYWGDTRADALDLQTVNGLEVGKWDQERDPKEWRKKIKIMEGVTSAQQTLRSFVAPTPIALAMRTHPVGSSTDENTNSSRKRLANVGISKDDDDIRQSTKIIDEQSYLCSSQRKKTKVTVVVDSSPKD